MMIKLGVTMDTAHLVGWDAAVAFARHLGQDSATFRALYPDLADFSSSAKLAGMVADLIDAVGLSGDRIISVFMPKGFVMPARKPYPRPGQERETQIGKDPIPIAGFDEWYYGR